MPRLMGPTGALVLSVGALLLAGCQKPLSDTECDALLSRYTEMLMREEQPGATPEQVAHAVEQAERAAGQDPRFEMAECPRRIRRPEFECAMNAPSVDAVERCLIF